MNFVKASEPHTRHPADHFETVLDAVSEAVFTLDRGFVITSFNRAAERLTGYRRSTVIGRRCADVFQTEICETVSECPMAQMLAHGGTPVIQEVTMHDREGRELNVRIRFYALRNDAGQIVGGVQTMHATNGVHELSRDGRQRSDGQGTANAGLPILAASERRAIEEVLERHGWNRIAAARELGISRITLWRKMRKLHIVAPTAEPGRSSPDGSA